MKRRSFMTLLAAPGLLANSTAISLPAPGRLFGQGKPLGVRVEDALGKRRSIRTYTREALTVAEVGQLLWAAQGVTSPDGKRTAPSAMHRYPLEIAVVAQHVDGLPEGAYRYVPSKHSLETLVASRPGARLLADATPQAQVHAAPAVFVIAAVYERMGTGMRNRTWTDYEAGLASQNLLLQAVSLGLGAVVTGGIDTALVKQAVKFSGTEEVIVVIPVGHPAA